MSKIWELSKSDFLKGLIVAVLSAPIALIVESLNQSNEIEVERIGTVMLVAFLSYILKQLGTDEEGKFGGVI